MQKIIYLFQEELKDFIEGTIIDFETIGEFNNASSDCDQYNDIQPVIFGTLEKNQIMISYIKEKEDITELIELIRDKIFYLTPPLYAFNCEFEQCIIRNCLGIDIEFKDLQLFSREKKEIVCKKFGIPNYDDPFNGSGKLCYEAWLGGKCDDSVKHNRACLLKEADILNIRGHK